jgi:hypothetical protein
MWGDEYVADTLNRVAYPDKILLSLPLLFGGVYGAGELVVEADIVSLGVAGLLCSALVCDALFVRPPTTE